MSILEDVWESTVDTFTSTAPWKDANLSDFSAGLEEIQRAVLPEVVEDYYVGLNRIVTGQVGEGDNPSWSEAWKSTDQTFQGWLPGGQENPVNDWWDKHKDDAKQILVLVAVLGAAVLSSKKGGKP